MCRNQMYILNPKPFTLIAFPDGTLNTSLNMSYGQWEGLMSRDQMYDPKLTQNITYPNPNPNPNPGRNCIPNFCYLSRSSLIS